MPKGGRGGRREEEGRKAEGDTPGRRNPRTGHSNGLLREIDLEKGKGLNFRALGLRPFPRLGQKNSNKMKNGSFGVVRRAFHNPNTDFYIIFYARFREHNVFLPNPCFR